MTVEELYPFLYAEESPGARGVPAKTADAVLAEVRRSTVEKSAEIVALRTEFVEQQGEALEAAAADMADRFEAGGRLFTFGNGGSSTDATDVAALFLTPPQGRPLPAMSLTTRIAVITALANDVGFDVVYARQLAAQCAPADMAFGISTSGGSENVLRAFEEARRRRLLTIGLAGYDGGRMAEAGLIDHLFVIPSASVHRIQEAQTTAYHVLWSLVQSNLPK